MFRGYVTVAKRCLQRSCDASGSCTCCYIWICLTLRKNTKRPFWTLWIHGSNSARHQYPDSNEHREPLDLQTEQELYSAWKAASSAVCKLKILKKRLKKKTVYFANCEPLRRVQCLFRKNVIFSDSMALGYGSKKSVSCDQEVTPAALSNEVSKALILKYFYVLSNVQLYAFQDWHPWSV